MSGKRLCAVAIVGRYLDNAGTHIVHSVAFHAAANRDEADAAGRAEFLAKWTKPGLEVLGLIVEPVPTGVPA